MAATIMTLVGNIATAPEVQATRSGKKFVRFRIATNERYRDQAGEWQEHEAVFHDVEAWGDLAELIGAQLATGAPVLATGPLRAQSWQTEEGQKRVRKYVKLDAIGPDLARVRPVGNKAPEATQPPAEQPDEDWSSES